MNTTATIAVIEDDETIRTLLQMLLRNAGFTSVRTAERGDTGLELVRRHKPDHQENAHRFSPRIEKKRKRDKNAAAVCVVFQYEICQHQKRQEHIEEKEVGKYHVGFAFPAPACFPSTGAVILYHSAGGL